MSTISGRKDGGNEAIALCYLKRRNGNSADGGTGRSAAKSKQRSKMIDSAETEGKKENPQNA
jgi:hypothetical protein